MYCTPPSNQDEVVIQKLRVLSTYNYQQKIIQFITNKSYYALMNECYSPHETSQTNMNTFLLGIVKLAVLDPAN